MIDVSMDEELKAMAQVLQALQPLEPALRSRVAAWAIDKLGIELGARALSMQNLSSMQTPSILQNPLPEALSSRTGPREGTVSHVAMKLQSNSCRTYMWAAAAYLEIYMENEQFTKSDLIETARDARGWKASYNNQIPVNIKRMLEAGELIEKKHDVFALNPAKLEELYQKLA